MCKISLCFFFWRFYSVRFKGPLSNLHLLWKCSLKQKIFNKVLKIQEEFCTNQILCASNSATKVLLLKVQFLIKGFFSFMQMTKFVIDCLFYNLNFSTMEPHSHPMPYKAAWTPFGGRCSPSTQNLRLAPAGIFFRGEARSTRGGLVRVRRVGVQGADAPGR